MAISRCFTLLTKILFKRRSWRVWGLPTISARLKEQAEASFANVLEGIETSNVEIEKMIVIGLPFVEILKIARDLDLPMIVMGIRGQSTPAEEILFGSTAEKVLRGTRVPVLCVPF